MSMDWSNIQSLMLANGILLIVFGYIYNYIKYIPAKIYEFLIKRVFYSIEFRDADMSFDWFQKWYAKQKINSHSFLVRGFWEEAPSLVPNYGINWFKWNNVWIIISKKMDTEQKYIVLNENSGKKNESFTLTFLSYNLQNITDFINEISPTNTKGFSVYAQNYGGWSEIGRKNKRPLESMHGNVTGTLIQDARRFIEEEKWYRENNIPWRRGYLLYGPPGNGKSSSVSVLASELDMNVYIIDASMTDKELISTLARVKDKSIILLEDVDCLFNNRDKADDVKMTFSGLLNALDGVIASEGRILILTTNHPENLDEALTRSGRCDRKFLFSGPSEEDISIIEKKNNMVLDRSLINNFADIQLEVLKNKNAQFS